MGAVLCDEGDNKKRGGRFCICCGELQPGKLLIDWLPSIQVTANGTIPWDGEEVICWECYDYLLASDIVYDREQCKN